jgi:hypothetical protein
MRSSLGHHLTIAGFGDAAPLLRVDEAPPRVVVDEWHGRVEAPWSRT